ncbi:hypothetical protein POM88_013101 [Heracleum sosnowskyi]|uniref:Vps52 C-terminal domain-containing protein n=1 Tax=Heracleum sosnowskyi TaxID=360622 RepID=A0AAD8GY27_9APIA|nr:hypothetical protein POM88_049354 [Heracleum sosnowskyi]KAK1394045.1 hypothetical protein POM88_013101 [Heracleum sosnowskyi]
MGVEDSKFEINYPSTLKYVILENSENAAKVELYINRSTCFSSFSESQFTVIDDVFSILSRITNCYHLLPEKINPATTKKVNIGNHITIPSTPEANVKSLWEDDVHPHYVMRRYAEFTASLIHLNVEYGDGQLELNMERLRMAGC